MMEKLIQFLIYKKNPLRQLGIVGLKAAHLEADPIKNKQILDKIKAQFSHNDLLSNYNRSLAQFLCQESLFTNTMQKITSKVIFYFSIPFLVFIILVKSFKKDKFIKCDVFIFEYGDLDYAKSDYKNKSIATGAAGAVVGKYFGFYEIKFLLTALVKYPKYLWHPKLIVNILRWLSAYAWVVKYRNPDVVATFFEGTASSSFLTEYLHSRGIQHDNFSHGEHFRYDCYSAFANFDKYTIWGEYFKHLQIEKHCREEMFVTRAPDKFLNLYHHTRYKHKKQKNQLTVLIHSGVEKGSLEYNSLVSLILKLESGWSIVLRPHPVDRASWPKVFDDLVNEFEHKKILITAEYPEDVSMSESVLNSPVFVGSASAALLEALLSGCKIIYIPGRIKNIDILLRHKDSENVFSFDDDCTEEKLRHFISTAFFINKVEDAKIEQLFNLGVVKDHVN